MHIGLRRHARAYALSRRIIAASCLALGLGCGDSEPTAPPPERVSLADIDVLRIFVRNWQSDNESEYVQADYFRIDGRSMVLLYRPVQLATGGMPTVPRLLLDSIGPQDTPPTEIVELVNDYDVWAMADSNAAGAACSTRTGQWTCDITDRDYSIVLLVESGGTRRSQRYTRLETNMGNGAARALGDFVFEWSRRHGGSAIPRDAGQARVSEVAAEPGRRAARTVHPVPSSPGGARRSPAAATAAARRR